MTSVQFSHSVMSNCLQPHGLQHARPPCPSPTPRVYGNSCLLSWWRQHQWGPNSLIIILDFWSLKCTTLNITILQIAEKRREAKGKGEKERYTHLNAEFQRIARRDKKTFHSDQCKEIEENNRMGKTGDLFKKMRDTKWIFNAKMGTIKDRNGMDLTEAEDIKKRWQEYKEEL